MARSAHSTIEVEWFNVTYRSVLTLVVSVLTVAGLGIGAWYYFWLYSPKADAAEAIQRAERRLGEASALQGDERLAELLGNAGLALREAREGFVAIRYDDARVAAIRSENWSLQALRMGRGQELDDELVRFYRIEGDVRVKKAGQFSWDAANAKMVLHIGDQVKTSSSASAQLIYFDGTVTTIQPGSLLEIRELYEDPVTKVRRVRERLSWGELEASTQKRNVAGSFHEVATEKSAARAEDEGEFRVRFDRERKTGSYDVFAGRIEVATSGRRESLVAGESIRSTATGGLTNKQTLPPAPRLVAPRDQRVFISESPEQEAITLSWEGVPVAARYHLMISNQTLFTDTLFDAEREGTRAVLEGVTPGAYYWRVSSISGNDVEGQFSAARRFRVSSQKIRDRSDSEPPDLEITEFVPVGMMVIVNGRTEPGAVLWVDDEKIDVSDNGTFYTVVRLRKEGLNELRFVAQDTAGNETVLNKSAHVELF